MSKENRDAIFGEIVRYTGLGCLLWMVFGTKVDRPEMLFALLAMMGVTQWKDLGVFGYVEKAQTLATKVPILRPMLSKSIEKSIEP